MRGWFAWYAEVAAVPSEFGPEALALNGLTGDSRKPGCLTIRSDWPTPEWAACISEPADPFGVVRPLWHIAAIAVFDLGLGLLLGGVGLILLARRPDYPALLALPDALRSRLGLRALSRRPMERAALCRYPVVIVAGGNEGVLDGLQHFLNLPALSGKLAQVVPILGHPNLHVAGEHRRAGACVAAIQESTLEARVENRLGDRTVSAPRERTEAAEKRADHAEDRANKLQVENVELRQQWSSAIATAEAERGGLKGLRKWRVPAGYGFAHFDGGQGAEPMIEAQTIRANRNPRATQVSRF